MEFENFYSLATREGSSRALRTIAGMEKGRLERDKAEYEELQKKKKEEEDKIKATMGSLIDTYNRSSSTAMKNQVRESMRSFYGNVDPYLRPALDPYLNHSPISPEAEKEARFLEQFPEPQSPYAWGEINGKPLEAGIATSSETIADNPLGYASKYFAYEEWKRKKSAVVLGLDPGEPKSFLKIPSGGAALRSKDGSLAFYNDQELGFKEAEAKGFGTIAGLIADEGYSYAGTKYKIIKDGKQVEMVNGFNVFNSSAPVKPKELSAISLPKSSIDWEVKYPAGFSKFQENFLGKNTKDAFAMHIDELINNGNIGTAEAELAATFPGLTYEIVPKTKIAKEFMGLISYSSASETVILPHKGRKIPFGVDEKGKPTYVWIDEEGLVRDRMNQPMGTFADAKQLIAQQTAAPSPPSKKEVVKEPLSKKGEFTIEELDKLLKGKTASDLELLQTLADITNFTVEELYYKPFAEIKRILKGLASEGDRMRELQKLKKGGKS